MPDNIIPESAEGSLTVEDSFDVPFSITNPYGNPNPAYGIQTTSALNDEELISAANNALSFYEVEGGGYAMVVNGDALLPNQTQQIWLHKDVANLRIDVDGTPELLRISIPSPIVSLVADSEVEVTAAASLQYLRVGEGANVRIENPISIVDNDSSLSIESSDSDLYTLHMTGDNTALYNVNGDGGNITLSSDYGRDVVLVNQQNVNHLSLATLVLPDTAQDQDNAINFGRDGEGTMNPSEWQATIDQLYKIGEEAWGANWETELIAEAAEAVSVTSATPAVSEVAAAEAAEAVASCEEHWYSFADVNGDCSVDMNDVGQMFSNVVNAIRGDDKETGGPSY